MNTKNNNWIEINQNHLKANIRLMKSVFISNNTKFMIMVKANAYGHGLIEISQIASEEGAAYLAVSCIEEALHIRKNQILIPILLLSEPTIDSLNEIIKHNITLSVYDYSFTKKLSDFAQKFSKTVTIHIKVDTGMNRFGFQTNNALEKIIKIKRLPNIVTEGIFTHFADVADDISSAKIQLQKYNQLCADLQNKGISFKYQHTANSSALVWLPKSQLNLVRFGVAVYGMQPSQNRSYPLPVKPVLSWKTRILQIKKVQKGEYIGYGKHWQTSAKKTIAIIGVGYADGFRRSPHNFGTVLFQGIKIPLIGNVTMNYSMIDISKVKNPKLSEEVVIIGKQNNQELTVEAIAKRTETINEEITSSISPLLPRYIV